MYATQSWRYSSHFCRPAAYLTYSVHCIEFQFLSGQLCIRPTNCNGYSSDLPMQTIFWLNVVHVNLMASCYWFPTLTFIPSFASPECPVCRDPIDQPSTALMDNMFAALDPDQTASPQPDTTHLCTACEENQEAGFYCLQCEEWLCDSCVDAHKRVRITKDHTISPKNEVSQCMRCLTKDE